MAVRHQDLEQDHYAVVYRFPVERVRAREARRRAIAIRRRRLGVGLVVTLTVVATLFATGPSGIAPASRPGAPRVVRLAPGDTLWDLATVYAPSDVDPRAYVDAILEINDIAGLPQAGETIKLPG
jgi:hypothetical protein